MLEYGNSSVVGISASVLYLKLCLVIFFILGPRVGVKFEFDKQSQRQTFDSVDSLSSADNR